MRRRFVVAVSNMTEKQEREFIEFVKEDNGLGWWHWIDNFWLLTGTRGDITAQDIRDGISRITGQEQCLVMEIPEDITWSGTGPTKGNRNMFQWLKTTWK